MIGEVELTRRDALEALAVGGLTSGGALAVSEGATRADRNRPDPAINETDFVTIEAVADTIYPSRVEVSYEFIETYVGSLGEERKASISRATADLEGLTRSRYGTAFHEMSSAKRDAALRSLGVDRALSRTGGNRIERIKYHLVNTLLYALFTSPTGSELVGIQNPVGHPGGYESLMRSPDEELD